MEFLSDEWLAALSDAANRRSSDANDPLADLSLTIEQVVTGVRSWRLVVDHGTLRIDPSGASEGPADVRLTSDRATAEAIAAGRRAALDAFITGDLVIGGDIGALLDRGAALEALGDVFADVRRATTFDATPSGATDG